MSRTGADRNLVFGNLAVQFHFITRERMAEALEAWAAEPSKSLCQVLFERAALDPETCRLIESLVDRQLNGPAPPPQVGADGPAGPRPPVEPFGTVQPSSARSVTVTHAGPPPGAGGRFRPLRRHARGGVGEVRVALDEELQREVALKELQPQFADHPESRERFVREAEITGYLEHPGVVPVYGLGWYPNGRPYYAMRFIRGETLRETIRRFHLGDGIGSDPGERLLARNRLLRRFVAVCETIHFAHSRNVVHRDIKPGNVMLGPFGETLVVDWGLAQYVGAPEPGSTVGWKSHPPLQDDRGETRPAGFVGTPQYASPEQAAEGSVGPASDVYSLGATLYTLLTNRGPVDGEAVPVILDRVRRGDFPAPSAVYPRVPKPLEAVCLKAMALRPSDRYPTARALGEDIERFLDNEPVRALSGGGGPYHHPIRVSVRGLDTPNSPNSVLFRSEPLTGPVLIGRQREETEAVFSVAHDGGLMRVVVAGFREDTTISRHQAVFEPQDAGKVLVRNPSPTDLRTRNQGVIGGGKEVVLSLPVELVFHSRLVFVEPAGGGLPSGLVPEDAGQRPVGLAPSDSLTLAHLPESDLDRWFRAVVSSTSHADRNDLFRETLRNVLGAIQLDLAEIVLRSGEEWVTQAIQPPEAVPSRVAKLRALGQLSVERRAVWYTPTTEEEGFMQPPTVEDMSGILAAPILGPDGAVVGAIYGERAVTSVPTKQQVRLESMFLSLVASLLAPRILTEPGRG
jgi:serine/threonine protein kinase